MTGVLSSSSAALGRLWAAINVKGRGQYPLGRLLALREFARETPCWRLLLVLVLTPIPSLLFISLLEVARLSSPNSGLEHQGVFFARTFVSSSAVSFTMLQQSSLQLGPSLPISSLWIAVVDMMTVVVNVSFMYALAVFVGFPMPFSIQLCAPNQILVETLALVFTWRNFLRADPTARRHIVRRGAFLMCQGLLITVYPIYYFLFTLVPASSAPRLAFLSLLPLIKLVNRQLFHRTSRKEDGGMEFVPQVVVFNADVLGALFVAFCMQYKPSMTVALAIAATKVVTAVLSFREIRQYVRQLAALEAQLQACRQLSHDKSPREVGAVGQSVLDEVARITTRHAADDAAKVSTLASGKMTAMRVVETAALGPRQPLGQPLARSATNMHGRGATRVTPLVIQATQPVRLDTGRVGSKVMAAVLPHESSRSLHPHKEELKRLEQRYVAFVAGLLYMAEFAILIEYVEVVVPTLYVFYLVVMFYMPNKVYYVQFAGMDSANLTQTAGNVLLYTAFELLSLVVVHASLKRLLRMSPARQLGFVLTRQAVHVQSALLLWVVFSTQTSLEHYGIDYSFRFAWLSTASNATQ